MKETKYTHPIPCYHCGKMSELRVVGTASDTEEDDKSGIESGIIYELLQCPTCKGILVRSGFWHDGMDGPDEWLPKIDFPKRAHFEGLKLLAQHDADMKFMKLAVEEAARCVSEQGRISPKVGAVAAKGLELIGAAHRSEINPGEHAEFTLLEKKYPDVSFAHATLYTTLEPCTSRNHPKRPCVQWIIDSRVSRVVIGMLDPNENIRGKGVFALRDAGIQVDLFPRELMHELEGMNRQFIRSQRQGGDAKSVTASPVGPSVQDENGAGGPDPEPLPAEKIEVKE